MNTLDELERLLKAGTKGPWETKQNKAGNTTIGPVGYSGFITPWVCDDENAALIVAAINALPGLIESARRVEEMQAALKTIDRFSLIIEVGVRNTEPQFQPEIVAGLLKTRAALKAPPTRAQGESS
jgi:hypothetical protein